MESEKEIIKLRPHHLLCTQGYSGKGYDEKFVLNMTYLTARMREDPELKVQIVFRQMTFADTAQEKEERESAWMMTRSWHLMQV
jgi:hypothetical protein